MYKIIKFILNNFQSENCCLTTQNKEMGNILIKSDANISFDELTSLLKKVDAKIIGLWDTESLETNFSKQILTEKEFLESIEVIRINRIK